MTINNHTLWAKVATSGTAMHATMLHGYRVSLTAMHMIMHVALVLLYVEIAMQAAHSMSRQHVSPASMSAPSSVLHANVASHRSQHLTCVKGDFKLQRPGLPV